jgi:hypothetical protein
LVVKGYLQVLGLDYEETFAPVARHNSLRILLSLGASLGLEIDQCDVVTAFLIPSLDPSEQIHMHYPDGYISPTDSPTTGCLLLLKSLYGLKQAPRIWNIEIDSFLKSLRFHPTDADPCVYSRRESTSSFTFIGLYVDDLILVGTRLILDSIKPILNEKFGITDLGPIKYCLGFEIIRSPHSLSLLMHQHSYMLVFFRNLICPSVPLVQLRGSHPSNYLHALLIALTI